MRRWNYEAAAHVDRAAFGAAWGHDASELDEIRHATPRHRARYRFEPGRPLTRELHAFAVAGASSEHGYLQRLSVDPAHQRRGHGRALTIDALRWMTRLRLPDCLVNTSVANAPALALYESVGFVAMPRSAERDAVRRPRTLGVTHRPGRWISALAAVLVAATTIASAGGAPTGAFALDSPTIEDRATAIPRPRSDLRGSGRRRLHGDDRGRRPARRCGRTRRTADRQCR